MLTCINKNFEEYQTLKDKSGILDSTLEAICRDFLDKYDRFPNLDELPNANSEPYLRQTFRINQHNGVNIDNILQKTGVSTIEEANAVINDRYRDLEVSITPINKEAIVEVEHRPTDNNFNNWTEEDEILDRAPRDSDGNLLAPNGKPSNLTEKLYALVRTKAFNRLSNSIYDPEPNGYLVLNNALQKLASLYGIKFNEITDAELNSDEWKDIIPDVNSVNAFVYNGQIYINLDRANLDAPLHEMMHILVGSIRFLHPSLYANLINLSEQFPNYDKLTQLFPGRTKNDVNEEIFILEVSKYLVGLPSNIANIDTKLQYEISYNVKRLLDTILMGLDSVKTLSDDRIFTLSLKQIALEINSSIMSNKFHGMINVEGSELHRKLNNIKSDLYSLGILEEYCD